MIWQVMLAGIAVGAFILIASGLVTNSDLCLLYLAVAFLALGKLLLIHEVGGGAALSFLTAFVLALASTATP